MGEMFDFKYPSCGYAEMLSGRDDCGMTAATTTILCQDCKKLYDVLISSKAWDANSYEEPFCPKNRYHNIRRWKHPEFCQKCGEK